MLYLLYPKVFSNLQCLVSFRNLKGIIFCWKQLPVKTQIDTYFVSSVKDTINFSSNVKKTRIACFLYFTHLILKLIFLTLWWKNIWQRYSYYLFIWTIKLNIYAVLCRIISNSGVIICKKLYLWHDVVSMPSAGKT